jgi:Tol biopolymer transport system component
VFSLEDGDIQNLWAARISGNGTLTGEFRRLTAGAGNEIEPSCSTDGLLTFASLDERKQIWSVPLNSNRGVPTGPLERVMNGAARREYPSLPTDGNSVAYVSEESGRMNIQVHDLKTGREFPVAPSPFVRRYPELSPTAAHVAFSSYEGDKRLVYVSSLTGPPELFCQDCLRATGWSSDERSLLVYSGNPFHISVLDIPSRKQTVLVEHPSYSLLYGRFSPQNQWVSFTARTGANKGKISIARVDRNKSARETEWITISEEGPEDKAYWSSDGRILYFTSGRDGHNCLWGQRLDVIAGTPIGAPFAVLHLHDRLVYAHRGWSVGGGRIAMTLSENTSNIWMLSSSVVR